MKKKISLVGTATIDLIVKSQEISIHQEHEALKLGAKLEVDLAILSFGGGAMNVAASLSSWGLRPRVFVSLGKDEIGEIIFHKLKKMKIGTKVFWRQGHSPLSIVVLSPSGERTILVYRGVSGYFTKKDLSRIPKNQDLYYVGTGQIKAKDLYLFLKRVKKNGNFIVVNPSKIFYADPNLKKTLAYIDFLILNEEEFKLLQKNLGFENIKEISSYNPSLTLIITRGEKNGYVFYQEKIYSFKPYPIDKVIDKTGAGDAFISGFIYALLSSKEINIDSINLGVSLGSYNAVSVIQKFGAQNGILKFKELKKVKPLFIKEINQNEFEI
jgi:sugar/nucleoside kinase (ribokinase family)